MSLLTAGSSDSLYPPLPSQPVFHPPHKIEDLSPVQQQALDVHASDLIRSYQEEKGRGGLGRLGALQKARRSPTMALIKAAAKGFGGLITAFIGNPTLPFTSPLGWAYSVLAVFLLTTGLLIADIGLLIFEKLGGYKIVNYVSVKRGKGLSLINMANPEMLKGHQAKAIFAAAKEVLSAPVQEGHRRHIVDPDKRSKETLGGTRTIDMNLDVTKAMLILSALVYERKEAMVAAAAINKRWTEQRLFAANHEVYKIAAGFGLRFAGMSDFSSVAGSYAGAFWPAHGKPFIIVAMKGTTPDNFCEFIVDTTINHEDAGSYLFGSAHQGLYNNIFPSQSSRTHINPHRRMCQIVRRVAEELLPTLPPGQDKIPLWVTGHSLGAGLATLLYTRFLAEPTDLGPHVALADGFVFGCPRVGDADFCAAFEKLLEKAENCHRNLWRIANEKDIVAKVPPGLADYEELRLQLVPASLLNYGFVGTGVHLDWRYSMNFAVDDRGVRVGDTVQVVESGVGKKGWTEQQSGSMDFPSAKHGWFIRAGSVILKIFVPYLRDHFPSRYWVGLARVDGFVPDSSLIDPTIVTSPSDVMLPTDKHVVRGSFRIAHPGESSKDGVVGKTGRKMEDGMSAGEETL